MKALSSPFTKRFLVSVVISFALAACSHPEEKAAEEEKVTPVEVAEAQTSSIQRIIEGEGVLFPLNQATVMPKIPGLIRALHVNRGDRVRKGQALAELEARDLGATVSEAQAMVAQAEAAVRSASADVSRTMADLAKQQAELSKNTAELGKGQAELNRETAALGKDIADLNRQTAEFNNKKTQTLPEELRKAALDVERAAAAMDAAKKALDARQDLFNQGALSRRQVEEANLAYTQARTERDAAQGHLESLQSGQKDSVAAIEAEVEGARSQVAASRAQVEAAKSQITGAQAQVESTRAEVEAAKAQLESSRSQMEAARSQLDAAKARSEGATAQVSYARVTSPIDGVVSDRPLYEGEMTGPEKPILTVMDVSRVIARVNVPNAQLPFLKAGDTATVQVSGTPLKGAGKVTVIAPALDANSATAEIWVEIENAKGDLRPGSVVRVSIVVETVASALIVPVSALLQSGEGETIVLVVSGTGDDTVVHEKKVEVGIRDSANAQIVEGLKSGDLVVTVGGNGLEDGAKVKIREEDEDEDEAPEEGAK